MHSQVYHIREGGCCDYYAPYINGSEVDQRYQSNVEEGVGIYDGMMDIDTMLFRKEVIVDLVHFVFESKQSFCHLCPDFY